MQHLYAGICIAEKRWIPIIYESEIRDRTILVPLFEAAGLKPIEHADYTMGLFDNGKLLGTGSLKGSLILGVVLDESVQGEGYASKILTHLITVGMSKGIQTLYLFTRPQKTFMFQSLGFRQIIKSQYAAMLEYGAHGIFDYQENLKKKTFMNRPEAAAIVMNCNPFTKGHRYLVEQAAAENEYVYVLVVEEDQSIFPFCTRFKLVSEGLSDLENVKVIPGGKYVVSQLTFPSYFTKEEDLAKAHATVDLLLFATYIAPSLNVTKRYVGTEPRSPVTAVYNQVMHQILPLKGVEVKELERVKVGNEVISASSVREYIRNNCIDELQPLLPAVTYAYLKSAEAEDVIQTIQKQSNSKGR